MKLNKESTFDLKLQSLQSEIVDATVKIAFASETEAVATFNIWDFGGQQIYYTSHQTFLSRRAIYLLVVDMNKPLDKVLGESEQDEMWEGTGTKRTPRGEL